MRQDSNMALDPKHLEPFYVHASYTCIVQAHVTVVDYCFIISWLHDCYISCFLSGLIVFVLYLCVLSCVHRLKCKQFDITTSAM